MARGQAKSRIPQTAFVLPGEVWAIPTKSSGYFPLVVSRATASDAPVPLAFVYIRTTGVRSLPSVDAIEPPADWGQVLFGLVSHLPFKKKRWERIGTITDFNPSDWPMVPEVLPSWGVHETESDESSLFSIGTTRDEATYTLLANETVGIEVARQFPIIQQIGAASRLESALEKHARGMTPNFHEMELRITPIDSALLKRWAEWADSARARFGDRVEPAIPAGRTTDRNVKPGDWIGLPMAGGGFGAALVVARKSGVVIFGDALLYMFPKVFDDYPTLDRVQGLRPDDACLLVGTSLAVVKDGRWRVLGTQPSFDASAWTIPRRWWQTLELCGTGRILIGDDPDVDPDISLPQALLDRDPHMRSVTSTLHSPVAIERDLGAFAHRPSVLKDYNKEFEVTPARLAVWSEINAAIESALARLHTKNRSMR